MSKGETPSVVESGTVLDAQLGKIRSSVTKMQSELTNYKEVRVCMFFSYLIFQCVVHSTFFTIIIIISKDIAIVI